MRINRKGLHLKYKIKNYNVSMKRYISNMRYKMLYYIARKFLNLMKFEIN